MNWLIFTLLNLLPLLLIFYNLTILFFGVFPSAIYFYRNERLHFSKGYNLAKLLIVLFLTLFSLIFFTLFLKSSTEVIFLFRYALISDLIVYFVAIIGTYILIKFKRPLSIFQIIKLYRNKETKDIDLMEIVPVILSRERKFQDDKKIHPIIKKLSGVEIDQVVNDFSNRIKLDNKSILELKNLLGVGVILNSKVEIITKKHGIEESLIDGKLVIKIQVQKKPIVLFLNEVLHLKEFWNSEEYSHSQIMKFIDQSFLILYNGCEYPLSENNISDHLKR